MAIQTLTNSGPNQGPEYSSHTKNKNKNTFNLTCGNEILNNRTVWLFENNFDCFCICKCDN